MNRGGFIKSVAAAITMSGLSSSLNDLFSKPAGAEIMPVLFIGHGSPMNAIEDNPYSREWKKLGQKLPRPEAILCISAHWLSNGIRITSVPKPETIHDFGGFPQALFDVQYPASGNPALAAQTAELFKPEHVVQDMEWGLDHGAWSVLKPMFPDADIPVIQLSLDVSRSHENHYRLAKSLSALRRRRVLIIGSGNIVHNLGRMQWKDEAYEWAQEFDDFAVKKITSADHMPLVNYHNLGAAAQLSIPSPDHYWPMLYILGLQEKNDDISFFNRKTTMGSVSMTSFMYSS